jgi:iron(III) transport system ATP-binding protein
LPPAQRDYGIVFQSYALFPNLSVADNVAYGLVNRKTPKAQIQDRVAELLKLVGLPGSEGKYPAQLSGGQQQRIALARALATSPGLLLLDEPLSALDALERVRLRQEIRALQQKVGVTTIMVTHDQEEALTMADRIVVMSRGRIEQVGTPDEIYDRPATPFVADFVGRMNFLSGTLLSATTAQVQGAQLVFGGSIGFGAGTAVTVCLRPEDVVVQVAGNGQGNVLEVSVGVMEFVGNHFATTLHVNGTNLNISADFTTNDVRALGIAAGATIRVQLPPERLRVFAEPPRGE